MKKTFLLLLISFISFSQSNKFKKGYYINNQEIKTECYILDNDWNFNPNSFDVKKNLFETPYNITIDDVKEFSIYDESKYIRENVDIDISPTDRESLSKNKDPEFKNKIVFLKVLVEGNNNLFSFESAQIPKRFFFNTTDSPKISQLIYKEYMINSDKGDLLGLNTEFINQLKLIESQKINRTSLNYNNKDLVAFFIESNKTSNKISKLELEKTKDQLNFNAVININNSSFINNIENYSWEGNYNTGYKTNFGGGFEIEYIIPSQYKKWSLAMETTYNVFKNNLKIYWNPYNIEIKNLTINQKSVQNLIGVKKYFTISNNFDINIALYCNLTFTNKKVVETNHTDNIISLNRFISLTPSIGLKYKKIYFDIKYIKYRLDIVDYDASKMFYKSFTLSVKYHLFKL